MIESMERQPDLKELQVSYSECEDEDSETDEVDPDQAKDQQEEKEEEHYETSFDRHLWQLTRMKQLSHLQLSCFESSIVWRRWDSFYA